MKIKVKLFEKVYSGEIAFIPIADLPKELLVPENNIMINVHKAFYTENNSSDGQTIVEISTFREQTKEEKEEFRKRLEEIRIKGKEVRRMQYLKLKKEFEP